MQQLLGVAIPPGGFFCLFIFLNGVIELQRLLVMKKKNEQILSVLLLFYASFYLICSIGGQVVSHINKYCTQCSV